MTTESGHMAKLAELARIVVAVGHPMVETGDPARPMASLDGMLVVSCSTHGEITDWSDDRPQRRRLQQEAAARHARDDHDDDVYRLGWA